MSTVTSQYVTSPLGKSEGASCFEIEDTRDKYTLFDVTLPGDEYTLSFRVKSNAGSSVTLNGSTYVTTTEWKKHISTFTASSADLTLSFGATGTYYVYHIKLERGNVATEWSVAPEDIEADINGIADKTRGAQQTADNAIDRVALAEATIQILSDCIKTLVVNEQGESQMTQLGDGWIFNMGSFDKALSDVSNNLGALTNDLDDTSNTVGILKQAVDDLGVMTEYVVISTHNDQPCIELGEIDSNFKVRITNTEIQFIDGSTIPAYLSNQKLNIEKAEVKNELQFGNFVWKIRSNGNMGLMYKGGST